MRLSECLISQFFGTAVCLLALFSGSGCGKQPEIEEHAVPPLAPALTNSEKEKVQGKKVRMLAAIFPIEKEGYFFKMEGDDQLVQKQFPLFTDLLKSIHFEEGELNWKLPTGWKNLPPSGMRLATIRLPEEQGSTLEISVIKLPMSGGTKQSTLDNVNRWRGQLGLSPVTSEILGSEDTKKGGAIRLQTEEGKITLVNLFGKKKAGGMMPPFAR